MTVHVTNIKCSSYHTAKCDVSFKLENTCLLLLQIQTHLLLSALSFRLLSSPPPPQPQEASEYENTFNKRIKRITRIMLVLIFFNYNSNLGPRRMLHLYRCPDFKFSCSPTVYVVYSSSLSTG